jgi:hypothetical protein
MRPGKRLDRKYHSRTGRSGMSFSASNRKGTIAADLDNPERKIETIGYAWRYKKPLYCA